MKAGVKDRELSSVLCDDLEEWAGGSLQQGDICILMANSRCCAAETNATLQDNYPLIKKKTVTTTQTIVACPPVPWAEFTEMSPELHKPVITYDFSFQLSLSYPFPLEIQWLPLSFSKHRGTSSKGLCMEKFSVLENPFLSLAPSRLFLNQAFLGF